MPNLIPMNKIMYTVVNIISVKVFDLLQDENNCFFVMLDGAEITPRFLQQIFTDFS